MHMITYLAEIFPILYLYELHQDMLWLVLSIESTQIVGYMVRVKSRVSPGLRALRERELSLVPLPYLTVRQCSRFNAETKRHITYLIP